MVIKTDVTPEEKAIIKHNAKMEGKSMTAYLRDKALCRQEDSVYVLMQSVEVLSSVRKDINTIATTVIRNKVIYEAEIIELLERMTALEVNTMSILKYIERGV